MRLSDRQLTVIAVASTGFLLYFVLKGATIALTALNVIGALVGLIGLFLWIWAATTLGKYLSADTKPKSPILIEGGPFAFVRHPIYLGATLIFIGISILGKNPRALPFIGMILLVEIEKARREEEELAKRFPGFEEYRKRVGFLLPRRKSGLK